MFMYLHDVHVVEEPFVVVEVAHLSLQVVHVGWLPPGNLPVLHGA